MRILIYRLGSLGDTVLALPCFHLIRASYPTAHITVLTNAPVSGKAAALASILDGTGLIDAVIPYPIGLRNRAQLVQLRSRLKAGRFDQVISLTAARGLRASLRDYLFFKMCGIRQVTGIPFRRRDMVCLRLREGTLHESEAERLLRRIRSLGSVDLQESKWVDLHLTVEEKAQATRLLEVAGIEKKFLALSLGTKSPLNDWGMHNWTSLLEKLSGEFPELGLILLGSGDEFTAGQTLLQNWNGPRANLCGKTSPRTSAAVLAQAALYVGHDSGPLHLAAAAGTRCVGIYSARFPPGQWFPIGRGHVTLYPHSFYDRNRSSDPEHQHRALASIQVDDVLTAIRHQLTGA